MTVRTFWTIFIKILGIWLVLVITTIIPQFLTVLPLFGATDNDNSFTLGVILVLLLFITLGIYILILRLFVFKTSWLIDKLHLDKGFTEEKIDLDIQRSTVLTIAIVVIGGIMFVDSLPYLCRQIFVFIQQDNLFRESPLSGWIIFYFAKTIIGYLLMTNSHSVIGFIEKQNLKQNDKDE
jgi:hypothetical protein